MPLPTAPMRGAEGARGLAVALRQDSPIALDINVHAARAEVLALVGPSGSGKSTILRCVAGFHVPQKGRVTCNGAVWLDTANNIRLPPNRRSVGFVSQSYGLFPHMSALGNVMAATGHLPRATRRAHAADLLARVHLGGLEDRHPRDLSGGQQQRVAVARALARDPGALLLDEPFSAVDFSTRKKLYVELANLRRDLDIPTLLVTHDLEEASILADTLSIIHHGKSLQIGTPVDIKLRPVSATVARLVDIPNIFDGIVLGHDRARNKTLIDWQGRHLSARLQAQFTPGEAVSWCIPASYVMLHRQGRKTSGDSENPIKGIVSDLLVLGETVRMTVAVGQGGNARGRARITVPVLMHVVERNHLAPGSEVTLGLREGGVHLMALEA